MRTKDPASRRAELLRHLVEFDEPCEPVQKELVQFGWEWRAAPLVKIERKHMLSVMDRFISGRISAGDLHFWADRLEGRDDISFDAEDGDLLREMLFRIANPEASESLTVEVVTALRKVLADFDPGQ
jgi:hypothetical protein